jgi:hypothetical protein
MHTYVSKCKNDKVKEDRKKSLSDGKKISCAHQLQDHHLVILLAGLLPRLHTGTLDEGL